MRLDVFLGLPGKDTLGSIYCDLADPDGDAQRVKRQEVLLAGDYIEKIDVVVHHKLGLDPSRVGQFHWACGDVRYANWYVCDELDGQWSKPALLRHYSMAKATKGEQGGLDEAIRQWQSLVGLRMFEKSVVLPRPERLSHLAAWSAHTQADFCPKIGSLAAFEALESGILKGGQCKNLDEEASTADMVDACLAFVFSDGSVLIVEDDWGREIPIEAYVSVGAAELAGYVLL